MNRFYFLVILTAMGIFSCDSTTDTWDNTKAYPHNDEGTNIQLPSDIVIPGEKDDYIEDNRLIWQKPELVLSLLDTLDGKTVADIGAGTGFFTFPLLPLSKKVIALDIDPLYLNLIDSIKRVDLIPEDRIRLETRLVQGDKIPLKDGEIDAAVIVNTFMFIPNHVEYLKELLRKLKPEGKVLIVDFKKRRIPLGPEQMYKIPLYQVENELYQAGFDTVVAYDMLLEYQYILLAKKGK